MKKVIYVISLLLLMFIIGLAVMASTAEKEYHIAREIDIHAASGFVFSCLASLEQMHKWSPWAELDPDMEVNILGNDGYPGAILEWSGNDKVGKGEQKLVQKLPFQRVETHYTFFEPYKSEMDSYIEMGTSYGTTHVIWGITGKNNFITRLYMAFTNKDMNKLMGKDLERGLENLKTMAQERLYKAENERLVREQQKLDAAQSTAE